MDLAEIERLVSELLATGDMNEDTVSDLERILAAARSRDSHPDDITYLQALHARILSPERVEVEVAGRAVADDLVAELRGEIARLQAELADARQTISELEAKLASGV